MNTPDRGRPATMPPGLQPAAALGPVRVMLVDDHRLVRSAVRHAIESPDVTVIEEAASLAEGLDRAMRARPDVILVDLDLGGVGDGIQLVRELAPSLTDTTFVMLSVSASEADLFESILAGAGGYLTKDVSPDALLRAVRSARRGELAMPRAMAARLVQRLASLARTAGALDEPELLRLSARERDVLKLVAIGYTDREIAAALTISPRTAETHVAAILRKLDVRNRSEAAMLYRRSRSLDATGNAIET
jgi:DNA-binding NarL/FixJ family response regulator